MNSYTFYRAHEVYGSYMDFDTYEAAQKAIDEEWEHYRAELGFELNEDSSAAFPDGDLYIEKITVMGYYLRGNKIIWEIDN